MTLSGQSDREQRRQAARDARQERAAAGAAKRPWLIPLLVAVAGAIVVWAIVSSALRGRFF